MEVPMPAAKHPEADPIPASEPIRSFKAGEEDGYQTDTFSRNDQEGLPSEAELTGREASLADVNRALDAGEEGAYRTDAFSRNDGEGLPDDAELIGDDEAGAAVEATIDADQLKAADDADSRDAAPPSAPGGGVR
jgi:hypothetical protein